MRRILAPFAVLALVATPALAATHHGKAKVEKTTKVTTVKAAKPKK